MFLVRQNYSLCLVTSLKGRFVLIYPNQFVSRNVLSIDLNLVTCQTKARTMKKVFGVENQLRKLYLPSFEHQLSAILVVLCCMTKTPSQRDMLSNKRGMVHSALLSWNLLLVLSWPICSISWLTYISMVWNFSKSVRALNFFFLFFF